MAKPAPRQLEVLDYRDVTSHMRRITFGGAGYANFPPDVEGSYIKLFFDHDGQAPTVRTYTVRHQRHSEGEIDVDFVLHGDDDNGVASTWAVDVTVGDVLTVGGPGPGRMINTDADWYFLAGDMTALPALSVNLALLPAHARGYVVIEVLSEADRQNLSVPTGMGIHWVVNPHSATAPALFLDKVTSLPWLQGEAAVWAACEFNNMRALRHYFKQQRQVGKQKLYVSSYWKNGSTEDQHKRIKREDADTIG